MSQESSNPAPPQATCLPAALNRDRTAMLVGGIASLLLPLGIYFACRTLSGEVTAVLAALAAMTVWAALAAPVLAVRGANVLSRLIRGGIVADAAGIALLVLWCVSPVVSFSAAVKVYCVLAGISLMGTSAVCVTRSDSGRFASALLVAFAAMLMLAGPFFMGTAIQSAGPESRSLLGKAVVWSNAFYSISAALFNGTHFVWNEARMMYSSIGQIQDYPLPTPRWYASTLVHLGLACVLAAVAIIRRPKTRSTVSRTPEPPALGG